MLSKIITTGRMNIFEGFLNFESVTIAIVNASQYDHLEEGCQTLISMCAYKLPAVLYKLSPNMAMQGSVATSPAATAGMHEAASQNGRHTVWS